LAAFEPGLASIYEISHANMLKSDGGSPGLYLVDTYIGAYKLDNLSTRIFRRGANCHTISHFSRIIPIPSGVCHSIQQPRFVTACRALNAFGSGF
jgi:hypothetical protein